MDERAARARADIAQKFLVMKDFRGEQLIDDANFGFITDNLPTVGSIGQGVVQLRELEKASADIDSLLKTCLDKTVGVVSGCKNLGLFRMLNRLFHPEDSSAWKISSLGQTPLQNVGVRIHGCRLVNTSDVGGPFDAL